MTPYDRLLELRKYLEAEIDIETSRPNYIGTQRALAYSRVLRRLTPIIRQAAKVRRQFEFFASDAHCEICVHNPVEPKQRCAVHAEPLVQDQPGSSSVQPPLAESSLKFGCSSGQLKTNKD